MSSEDADFDIVKKHTMTVKIAAAIDVLQSFAYFIALFSSFSFIAVSDLRAQTPNIFHQAEPGQDSLSLTEKGAFDKAWSYYQTGPMGDYIMSYMASDKRCRPGNLLQAFRAALRLKAYLEKAPNSVDLPALVPSNRQNEQGSGSTSVNTGRISRKDYADVKEKELSDALHSIVDDTALQIVKDSAFAAVNAPMTYADNYPCYESLPLSTPRESPLGNYLCFDYNQWHGRPYPNRSVFSISSVIKVNIPDADRIVAAKIQDAAMQSLRLWVSACGNCPQDTGAVIIFDNTIYMLRPFKELLERAASLAEDPIFTRRYDRAAGSINDYLPVKRIVDFRGRSSRDGRPLLDYSEVKRDGDAIGRLCRTQRPELDSRLVGIWDGLCGSKQQYNLFTIKMLSSGTMDCSEPDTIACENLGEVTLNVRDFTFEELPPRSGAAFGGGPLRVGLFGVMLHETGHWLGLSHSSAARAIMAPKYRNKMCLSEIDVGNLEEQSPGGGERAQSGALRFERAP